MAAVKISARSAGWRETAFARAERAAKANVTLFGLTPWKVNAVWDPLRNPPNVVVSLLGLRQYPFTTLRPDGRVPGCARHRLCLRL